MNNRETIEYGKKWDEAIESRGDTPFSEARQFLNLAIKTLEEVKGLRLLVDWAVECGFGYDNIPEEYEKYKEEISNMGYTEGLIYIAKKEAENEDD